MPGALTKKEAVTDAREHRHIPNESPGPIWRGGEGNVGLRPVLLAEILSMPVISFPNRPNRQSRKRFLNPTKGTKSQSTVFLVHMYRRYRASRGPRCSRAPRSVYLWRLP